MKNGELSGNRADPIEQAYWSTWEVLATQTDDFCCDGLRISEVWNQVQFLTQGEPGERVCDYIP